MLDTNVLVAALRSQRGASAFILKAVEEGKLKPVCTVPLFLEYEAVLRRKEHSSEFGYTQANISMFLTGLAKRIETTEVNFLYRPLLKDTDDDKVVEAALNGGARTIVTHNVKDFRPFDGKLLLEAQTPASLLENYR
ncbi:putative toxin-antitoxin system toxin component, PIN family [Parvularcula sp. BGMRC 0090]|uniref:Toxin-antitoxin system toxin component, PIN family n=1 Tax=Parvularcula maris TaxID=2965077 RepID=A0A9X2RIK5_9PROT|nr:putative toxin-antitoxin system toxin component, PIN family [Parvularcula maris]